MELLKGDTRVLLYRDGFAKPPQNIVKKKSPRQRRRVKIEGQFKEDGFERDFKNNSGSIVLSKGYRKGIIGELGKIMMQASAEPVLNADGSILGFLLDQIDPGSLYEKMGFRNGDIITEIDGMQLDSPSSALSVLQSLRNKTDVDYKFRRQGSEFPVSINIQ